MTWTGADVTVIIPTYNRAKLLMQAIESVRAQSVRVGRILIVDDGSTDETVAQVRALVAEDPRIELLVQANAGANAARNAGIATVATALVAFLDSDDRWRPTKLECQLDAWARRPAAVASFTGILAVDGDRQLFHYDVPVDPTLDDLRRHNALGTTSTAVVEVDVLRRVGGFDPGLPSCQDWDLWLRLRREGVFAVVPESLVLYEEGPHDRITSHPRKAAAGHQAVFARALDDVTEPHRRRRIRAAHAEVLSRLYMRHGLRMRAIAQATSAFVLDPSRFYFRKLAGTVRKALAAR